MLSTLVDARSTWQVTALRAAEAAARERCTAHEDRALSVMMLILTQQVPWQPRASRCQSDSRYQAAVAPYVDLR